MADFEFLEVQMSHDGKVWVPIGSKESWRLLRDPSNALAYAEAHYLADRSEVFKVKGAPPPKWTVQARSRVLDAKGLVLAEGRPASKARTYWRGRAADDGRIQTGD